MKRTLPQNQPSLCPEDIREQVLVISCREFQSAQPAGHLYSTGWKTESSSPHAVFVGVSPCVSWLFLNLHEWWDVVVTAVAVKFCFFQLNKNCVVFGTSGQCVFLLWQQFSMQGTSPCSAHLKQIPSKNTLQSDMKSGSAKDTSLKTDALF